MDLAMESNPDMTFTENARVIRLLLFALAAVCFQVSAQETTEPDLHLVVADEFNRGTPRSSLEGFLAAADVGDYETAAEYLDLRNLRGAASKLTGAQLARRLDVIGERGDWVDIDEPADDPAGRGNDGLPEYRDSIGIVMQGEKEVRLLLQKVPRGDGEFIWKVSNATVSHIPQLYEIYGYPDAIEELRRSLPEGSFAGFELFKWVVVLATAVVAYSVVFLLALATRRILGNRERPSNQRIFRFLAIPFGIWLVILAMNVVATSLGRGSTAETLQRISPVPILITVWVMFAAINLLRDIYSNYLRDKGRSGAEVLVRPGSNAIKLIVFLSAALIYLDNLGINITTVLAGLGVGGVAVALALQKPMEDIFGAITLYTQQPIHVGDFCRIGTTTGTIEEIGLRTTYVRTVANTLIAVPNARLASEPIDNISARKKILYRPSLRLRYDTAPDQLRNLLKGIRELLSSHERILEEGQRVRFNEIADDALKIEVFAYLDTTAWPEYLELAEELNLRILEIVAKAGTSLSLPASTLHIERSSGEELPEQHS